MGYYGRLTSLMFAGIALAICLPECSSIPLHYRCDACMAVVTAWQTRPEWSSSSFAGLNITQVCPSPPRSRAYFARKRCVLWQAGACRVYSEPDKRLVKMRIRGSIDNPYDKAFSFLETDADSLASVLRENKVRMVSLLLLLFTYLCFNLLIVVVPRNR